MTKGMKQIMGTALVAGMAVGIAGTSMLSRNRSVKRAKKTASKAIKAVGRAVDDVRTIMG